MDLEFKSWLCICEHEYIKLVKATLSEKVIDHNLICDHNTFAYQALIYSGMIRINLAILKFFIDDRNSFHIEERKNFGLYKTVKADEIEHQIVSQHKDEVKTDALDTFLINIKKMTQLCSILRILQAVQMYFYRHCNNNRCIFKLKFKLRDMNEKIK